MSIHLGTVSVKQAALCCSVRASQGTSTRQWVPAAPQAAPKSVLDEKRLPAHACLHSPRSTLPCKPFLFYYELFGALPFLLEGFSDTTQDVMGISGLMIILCPSIIEAVSINAQATNFLKWCVPDSSIWEFSGLKSQWSLPGGAPGFAISSCFRVQVADTLRIISDGAVKPHEHWESCRPLLIQTRAALAQVPTRIHLSFG